MENEQKERKKLNMEKRAGSGSGSGSEEEGGTRVVRERKVGEEDLRGVEVPFACT